MFWPVWPPILVSRLVGDAVIITIHVLTTGSIYTNYCVQMWVKLLLSLDIHLSLDIWYWYSMMQHNIPAVLTTHCLGIWMEWTKEQFAITAENYGKRQGTLKNNSKWQTARRMRFAINCSPRRSPFATYRAVHRTIRHSLCRFLLFCFHCSLFKVRYSMFDAPFAILRLQFAAHWAIRHAIRCGSSMSPDALHRQWYIIIYIGRIIVNL